MYKRSKWYCLAACLLILVSTGSAAAATKSNYRISGHEDTALTRQLSHCPAPLTTWDGQAATSIAGPFPVLQVARSASPTSASAPSCRWTLHFRVHGHDPTVAVYTGQNIELDPGVIDTFDDHGTDGVNCLGEYQIDNGYGGAAAQEALISGSCNTDGFTEGEGTVTIDNASLDAGPTVLVAPTFDDWYVSFEYGSSALVGVFRFCSEAPVGQHSTYACIQFEAGPYI